MFPASFMRTNKFADVPEKSGRALFARLGLKQPVGVSDADPLGSNTVDALSNALEALKSAEAKASNTD